MALFIFAIRSAGTGSILWTLFACSPIFFIRSDSVAAVALKGQSIPISLQANEGILFSPDSPSLQVLFMHFSETQKMERRTFVLRKRPSGLNRIGNDYLMVFETWTKEYISRTRRFQRSGMFFCIPGNGISTWQRCAYRVDKKSAIREGLVVAWCRGNLDMGLRIFWRI